MKILGKRKRKHVDIADSGALSDLAFLLIVFFIVIAVFTVNKGFMLGLPRKNSTKIVHVENIMKVKLDNNNEYYFDDKKILLEEVESLIENKMTTNPDATFILKIDKNAEYQYVIDVLNIIQKFDINNFSLSMMNGEET